MASLRNLMLSFVKIYYEIQVVNLLPLSIHVFSNKHNKQHRIHQNGNFVVTYSECVLRMSTQHCWDNIYPGAECGLGDVYKAERFMESTSLFSKPSLGPEQ